MWKSIKSNLPLVIIVLATGIVILADSIKVLRDSTKKNSSVIEKDSMWVAPSLYYDNVQGEERNRIIYGEELIVHTSIYLGPGQ